MHVTMHWNAMHAMHHWTHCRYNLRILEEKSRQFDWNHCCMWQAEKKSLIAVHAKRNIHHSQTGHAFACVNRILGAADVVYICISVLFSFSHCVVQVVQHHNSISFAIIISLSFGLCQTHLVEEWWHREQSGTNKKKNDATLDQIVVMILPYTFAAILHVICTLNKLTANAWHDIVLVLVLSFHFLFERNTNIVFYSTFRGSPKLFRLIYVFCFMAVCVFCLFLCRHVCVSMHLAPGTKEISSAVWSLLLLLLLPLLLPLLHRLQHVICACIPKKNT